MIPPKTLLGTSVCLLVLTAVLGVLNAHKTRGLREEVVKTEAALTAADRLRIGQANETKRQDAAVTAANARLDDAQRKITASEAELASAQNEKNDLQVRLRENETEIEQLRKRVEQPGSNANSSGLSKSDLQAQLDEARKKLETAEREKTLLSDKIRAPQKRATSPEKDKPTRFPSEGKPGIRGKVLAVNQAYNFVVLDLGGRQGVEPESEMLVLRGGSFIGRIRISSVEPATAIGDIITSSLARGVQVQPGDIVIYAGTNS